MNYVVILIDGGAPSFCYYERGLKKVEISMANLKKAIEYCHKNQLFATVVYPEYKLEQAKQKILDNFEHIRILPLSRVSDIMEGDILTIDYNPEIEQFKNIPINSYLNLILRLKMSQIRDLEMIYYNFRNRFARISVILTDMETTDEDSMNRYRIDLSKVKDYIFRGWNIDLEFQINIITDRMTLREMNNCNAGVTHFTIAPNGKFYICPGFYINNPKQNIGSFSEEIKIPNFNLLDISHSPICSVCDCYHCKRCVFLNKKMTFELNTPSHQQCVISHHERNQSGILLEKLHKRNILRNIPKIAPLFYLDPIETVFD